jgi:hypothetical protein
VPLGAACLRIVSYGNLGYAYFMVMMQAFNGRHHCSDYREFLRLLAVRDSLGVLGWLFLCICVPTEFFFSIAIAERAMAVISAILFKRGNGRSRRFNSDYGDLANISVNVVLLLFVADPSSTALVMIPLFLRQRKGNGSNTLTAGRSNRIVGRDRFYA